MKNRLSYCGIIITHADRYFFSKYNKNCSRDCACKTISPQGTVLRIGFLLTVILSSTSYCILFRTGRISAKFCQHAQIEMQTHKIMPADVVIVPYTSRIKITHHRRIEADLEREEQLHEKYAALQKC